MYVDTDYYMPTMGLVPNTEFLPKEWLTEKKYVDVERDAQVKGEKGIWALGDVVSKPRASYPETEAQATGVARNIGLALKGQDQQPVKGMPMDVFICSMGRDRGAGRVGWIQPPSLTIWYIKGRTLGMEKTKKYVDGTAF
jgi:apoptosis-inducing factor 2